MFLTSFANCREQLPDDVRRAFKVSSQRRARSPLAPHPSPLPSLLAPSQHLLLLPRPQGRKHQFTFSSPARPLRVQRLVMVTPTSCLQPPISSTAHSAAPAQGSPALGLLAAGGRPSSRGASCLRFGLALQNHSSCAAPARSETLNYFRCSSSPPTPRGDLVVDLLSVRSVCPRLLLSLCECASRPETTPAPQQLPACAAPHCSSCGHLLA